MLQIEDLHFRYRRYGPEVLRGVNLALSPGQIGVVLGRNGSGKSTLFGNIVGVLRPSSGKIVLDGEDLLQLSARRRAHLVGYVPQQLSFGDLTVYDTVLTGRIAYFSVAAGKEDHRIVARVLSEMGLMPLAQRKVTELSGGERQKIAIARALAQQPRLLVFDEPTGNLDIANEQLLLTEARRLAGEKDMAILVALHDFNQALQFGDRFFFLKEGLVCRAGGAEIVTEEAIADTFGAKVEVLELGNRKIILGGKKT